jgi:hypothetical protein
MKKTQSTHTVMTVIKIMKNRRNKDTIESSNTFIFYIHDCSLFWNGTDTSIQSDEDQLVLWTQSSSLIKMMLLCKYFPAMSKMYNL